MQAQTAMEPLAGAVEATAARARLLEGLPVTERRHDLAGISTAVLQGGEGPPMILLHGPGESAPWWLRCIPRLARSFHVIVPDLPGHGASPVDDGEIDPERMYRWLDELIDATAAQPPILVGHIFGGAIAVRYAARRRRRIAQVVLVDTLGLRRLRPAPGFALGLVRFMMRPTVRNHDRFMAQCMWDPDDLAVQMGEKWDAFVAYNLAGSRDAGVRAAMGALMKHFGLPRIPPSELAALPASTALIWGRADRATPLAVAEAASKRHGWPLEVVDQARDDPKLERPEEFVAALMKLVGSGRPTED